MNLSLSTLLWQRRFWALTEELQHQFFKNFSPIWKLIQRSTFSLLDLPEAEKPAEAFAECEFSPQITATASPLLPIQLPSSGLYEGTFDHLLLFPILLTKTQITVDPLSLSLGSSLTLLTDQGVDLKKLPKGKVLLQSHECILRVALNNLNQDIWGTLKFWKSFFKRWIGNFGFWKYLRNWLKCFHWVLEVSS